MAQIFSVMNRRLYGRLMQWKSSTRRKPLLLRGARQTGKTFLLREFGRERYDRVHYCNFEENPLLDSLFDRDLDPRRILGELSLFLGNEIRAERDLIIFDEIQASNRALNSLKYFQEQAGEFHVAAAGSLLGVRMSTPGSFPVGKVNFLDLHPMTFMEFLDAVGEARYHRMLAALAAPEPLAEAFHADLIALLRAYIFVGGMPEAVKHHAETGNAAEVREIQHEILDSYVLDFAKHARASDIPKLTLIWNSIPRHLAQENKKFVFAAVKQGARARDYENALTWLEGAGIIHRCHATVSAGAPLKHYADPACFKVYALDAGLLGALARSPVDMMVRGQRLFNEYEGALVENYVAQQMVAEIQPELFYWRSKGWKAELDFLCEFDGSIVPLEVKAGLNPKSKSLRSFDDQFHPDVLCRTSLLNLKLDGKICNIPLYAVSQLERFARMSRRTG